MHRDEWFGANGIYIRGELDEREVSAEMIFPDGGDGFQINCAVMIVGGSSVNRWKMDKLSMRLKFKGEYGPTKLSFPVFGDRAADEFNTLVLDARMNNSWAYGGGVGVKGTRPWGYVGQRDIAQYTRDQFVADIHNDMGGYSPQGRHVHLYLNGLYWGLYWVHERPDDSFAATYLGGEAEDYDVLKHKSGTVVSGSNASYNQMFSIAAGAGADAQYQLVRQYLDVTDFADYMITNYYVGNTDWAHQNWYASRNRVDPIGRWRYHSWDAEHVVEGLDRDYTGLNNSGGPTALQQRLRQNAEYRVLFGDRAHRHFFNNGSLTPDGAKSLYQIRLDDVDRAVVGESARWGDNHRSTPYTRNVEWVRERDWIVGTYLSQRSDTVLDQFETRGWYPSLEAPVFHINGSYQHGGQAFTVDALSMTVPASQSYIETELVAQGDSVRAHVPTDNSLGLSWVEKNFVPGAGWSDGSHPEDNPGDVDLWPIEPDGAGSSLTRISATLYGNDPNNRTPATPSPGV